MKKVLVLMAMVASMAAIADAEFVLISKSSGKRGPATAITAAGEKYEIGYYDGCPSLWRQKDKFVILNTSNVNSVVILPDDNQVCEISGTRLLGSAKIPGDIIFPECMNTSIQHITPFAGSIILSNGNILQAFIKDREKIADWVIGHEVTVCGYNLINQVTGDFIRYELIM